MESNLDTANRLKVYLESSFVSYLTDDVTANAKVSAVRAAGYHCPDIMPPKTFRGSCKTSTAHMLPCRPHTSSVRPLTCVKLSGKIGISQ